jgi:uncharacterized protein (DUF1015 family)
MSAMATVRPFRGIVYDHTHVADSAAVTCPPYDVISDAGRDELYDKHPYNVVRIVSGREEPSDGPSENRHTRAAGFFTSWLWEGVLRRDDEPAIYVYRQAFTDPSGHFRRIWGILATIGLDDELLAHERTMAGPKADRLALMRAVPANLSPIYALYKEPDGGISRELQSFSGTHPLADFVDDEATRHEVWAVHDPAFHERAAKALAGSPLFIADGHHRFETAKQFRAEQAGPGPWDDVMALLVDAGVQPACILPYHRIVRSCDAQDVLAVLARSFDVTPLGAVDPERVALELWDEAGSGVFVAFVGADAYRLVARSVRPDEIPAGILERLALEPLGALPAEEKLSFTPSASEVVAEAASGRARAGFLIQPVSVSRVWDLASSAGKMPEKSTYFHPKPRDGIVMRPLQEF